MSTFGLYIHLPYCPVRCPYCDFYTLPADHPARPERYLRALRAEIGLAEQIHRRIDTVYLGGGTPSLHPADELAPMFEGIRDRYAIAEGAEVTIEINPETVTRGKAEGWRELGINRASLGVQSLDDRELAWLGRGHTAADARSAFDVLREAGFSNVSLDLMFGLEGQTVEAWTATLREALAWKPEHVSAYGLTVEDRTRFGSFRKLGRLALPNDEIQEEMYLATRSCLEDRGLPAYEISNFARPGFESRHNLTYWTGGEYRGVGVSAHSFERSRERIRRFWNPRNVGLYLAALEKGRLPTAGEEILSPEKHWGERLMTGLRLRDGVDPDELSRDLGWEPAGQFRETVGRFLSSGHMETLNTRVHLTPKGILVSNEIFRELI